jgi:hypothetical protein
MRYLPPMLLAAAVGCGPARQPHPPAPEVSPSPRITTPPLSAVEDGHGPLLTAVFSNQFIWIRCPNGTTWRVPRELTWMDVCVTDWGRTRSDSTRVLSFPPGITQVRERPGTPLAHPGSRTLPATSPPERPTLGGRSERAAGASRGVEAASPGRARPRPPTRERPREPTPQR